MKYPIEINHPANRKGMKKAARERALLQITHLKRLGGGENDIRAIAKQILRNRRRNQLARRQRRINRLRGC